MVNQTQYIFTGLADYTDYSVTIKALDAENNVSAVSDSLTVKTLDGISPSEVTGIVASDITANSMKIKWDDATDNVGIKRYVLFLNDENGIYVNGTEYNATGLVEYGVYKIEIRAEDTSGNFSRTGKLRTYRTLDVTPPAVPKFLQTSLVATNSFKVTWSGVSDNAADPMYEVYLNDTLITTNTSLFTFYTFTGLNDFTEYSVYIKAKDSSGNISAASDTLIVKTKDATAPAAPTNLKISEAKADQLTVSWSAATDNDGISGYEVYVNGTLRATSVESTYVVTGLQNFTEYTITVKAKDNNNNLSALSDSIVGKTLDSAVPTTPTGLTASEITGSGFKVTWTASSDNNAVVAYDVWIDGSLFDTVTDTTITLSGLDSFTEYKLNVAAKDADGNTSAASQDFKVKTADITAPTAPQQLETAAVSKSGFRFTWAASTDSDAVKEYKLYLNGLYIETVTATSYTFTGLSGGTTYKAQVSAIDRSSNESDRSVESSVTTVETTAPAIPANLSASNVTESGFELTWTASTDDSGIKEYNVYLNGLLVATTSDTFYTFGSLEGFTAYTVSLKTVDINDNSSAFSDELIVKTLDSVSPSAPTNLQVEENGSGRFTISWTAATDNDMVDAYDIYLDGNYLATATETEFEISGLQEFTTYAVRIKAVDASGNVSDESEELQNRTNDVSEPTKPSGFMATTVQANNITVSWTASDDNDRALSYQVFVDNKLVATVTGTTYELIGLTNFTTYQITLIAKDSSGNASATSDELSVKTLDNSAPSVPSNLNLAEITANSATLAWSASTDNDKVAKYEIYVNGVLLDSVANTQYALSGLQEFTSYEITVKAVDASNNSSLPSASISLKTLDATAPSTPSGLQSSDVKTNQFTISWSASTDNDQVKSYDVFVDGLLVGSVTGTSFTMPNAAQWTEYKVTVQAKDAAGNLSVASEVFTVKTLDGLTPTVPSGLAQTNVTATSVKISWSASADNVGVKEYEIYRDGSLLGKSAETEFTVTALNEFTSYSVQVLAVDAAGNKSALSAAFSAKTSDVTAPSVPSGFTLTQRSASGFTVTWQTSTDLASVKHYEVFNNGVSVAKVVQPVFTLTGLKDYSKHSLTVSAVDEFNNQSALSAPFVVTTLDVTAPTVPGNLLASAVTASGFIVNWSASNDNQGVAAYEVYVNDLLRQKVTKTSFTASGFKSGLTYKVTVRAIDANGNVSAFSKALLVKLPDKSAPTVPMNVTLKMLTGAANGLSVTWGASTDNVAVTGYEIYRNGTLVGKSSTRNFIMRGMTTADVVTVTIRAYDAAGNKSAASKAVKSPQTIRVVGKQMYVNFKLLNLGTNGAPVVRNNETMAPHKPLLEALGFTLKTENAGKTIIATKTGLQMKLTQGNVVALMNGKTRKTMNVAPTVINGQLMISVNFIAKDFRYTLVRN